MIIAEFDGPEGVYTVVKENEVYNVYLDDVVVQPNHNAEGIIRYLANMAHSLSFKLSKSAA